MCTSKGLFAADLPVNRKREKKIWMAFIGQRSWVGPLYLHPEHGLNNYGSIRGVEKHRFVGIGKNKTEI